uniref:Carboxylesterase type B domain-containing protein n=1 Tax=Arion vulgaris TaxID=1028688 RepID=A0A0B7AHU2_9EUPU
MTKKRYTDIVTDFVRTGDPGRTLSEDLLFKWQAYNVKTKSYLRFDSYPTQQNYPLKDRLKLWDNLTPNDGEKVINYKLRDEL